MTNCVSIKDYAKQGGYKETKLTFETKLFQVRQQIRDVVRFSLAGCSRCVVIDCLQKYKHRIFITVMNIVCGRSNQCG